MSDVEIAVYLSEGEDYIQRKLEILGKLMELLETEEIDLVVLNTTPLTLRMKILENKKVMVDNDRPIAREGLVCSGTESILQYQKRQTK